MPFKIFVLAAGVARVPLWHFVTAIAIGRGIRYFGEGLLAVWYGEAAGDFLRDNAQPIALALAATFLFCGLGYILWSRRGERKAGGPERTIP